jgi:GMP synthase-like glutamine amidotransferase
MSVLILKNIANEGPGTIEDFLKEKGISYHILNMFEPGEMPDISGFSHLVVMGGPMAVYEMDKFPFLHIEAAAIRSFIKSGKAVLGICLGAQMIAYALGAEVYPGGKEETGWGRVGITQDGLEDPVMFSLSADRQPYAEVFQWHGDTYDLPENSVSLSSSEVYPNQAFRYRDNIYALQFHIEVTPDMIGEWFKGKEDVEDIINRTTVIYPEYYKRAMDFYDKFFA